MSFQDKVVWITGASSGIAGYSPTLLIVDANDGTYLSSGPFNFVFFGKVKHSTFKALSITNFLRRVIPLFGAKGRIVFVPVFK